MYEAEQEKKMKEQTAFGQLIIFQDPHHMLEVTTH